MTVAALLSPARSNAFESADIGRVGPGSVVTSHDAYPRYLDPATVIGVGLGYAAVTCDGAPVFEENGHEAEDLPTLTEIEVMARKEPGRDWRIHLVALLDERHYRRERDGRWKLYAVGYGLS